MIKFILILFILNIWLISCEQPTSQYECPYPLLYREKSGSYVESQDFNNVDYDQGYVYASGSTNETSCLLPCPGPIYDEKSLSKLSLLSKIAGSIFFASSVLVLLIYSPLINRLGYNRQVYSILFLSIGIMFITITDVIYFGVGDKLICVSKHKYARQDDIGCGITGVFFQFGSLSAIFWWVSLVFDQLLSLKKLSTSKYDKWYIIAIHSIILVLTFIPFAKYGYGYYVSGITCWILDLQDALYFFWIPYIILLIIGTILIFLISIQVYKLSKNFKIKEMGIGKLIKTLTLIIFIWIQFLLLLGFNGTISLNMDTYNDKMVKYIDCLLSTHDYKQCDLKTFPFELEFSVLFFLRFIGFELLLFFALLIPNQSMNIIKSNPLIQKLFKLNTINNNNNFNKLYDNEYSLNNINNNNNNNNKFILK